MHRFRKKSDAKRSQLSQDLDPHEALPELPPTNDFRTSLILPDLSRRFSLLRSATGDPVSVDNLRARLANQRARGAPNHISEEEEDMLLETLGRLRSRATPSPGASQEQISQGEDGIRNSVRSTGTTTSSIPSSPGRSTKRYSNNLFGSGRLRDYTYLKSVASSKGSNASTRTVSLTPTENSTRDSSNANMRPVTPESHTPSSSVQSTPEKGSIHTAPFVPPIPFSDSAIQAFSAAESRLQKTLGPSVLKRASMAIEQAIKEIEDEVEDEILLPRSVPVPRGSLDQPPLDAQQRHSNLSNGSSVYEAGMAITIDKTIHEFNERRASPIPARTVPGYVPGMPRPMTPRDFDFDEQRSHSTTPRAQSPYATDPPTSPILTANTVKLKRESLSSTTRPITPVSIAPLFLQRSTNGRFTPDDSQRSGNGDSVDFGGDLSSSLLARRRPASPLSNPPFQAMAVSTNRSPSRPTTPSNVIWTPNPNPNQEHKRSHSRNNSWATTDGSGTTSSDVYGSIFDPSKLQQRTLRSPILVEPNALDSNQNASTANRQTASGDQPHAYIPDVYSGSPLSASANNPRSDTPTQNGQRSPISPTFSNFDLSAKNGSRRSSRQNASSSPFNLNTFPSLGYSLRANSSRSSLDSLGSSFHSWDETDKVLKLFSDSSEAQPVAWHEFDHIPSSSGGDGSTDDDEWDPEMIIQRYAGLKKADIAAVQEKLVTAAFIKIANTDPRDRAPSALRRRRPSTSQSNYSRIASPPPQLQPPGPSSPTPYGIDDQFSKASALLNSVVDSIKEQPTGVIDGPSIPTSTLLDDKEASPNTRRNRDLAHVLFGTEDDEAQEDTVKFKFEPSAVVQDTKTSTIPNTPTTTPAFNTAPSQSSLTPPSDSKIATPPVSPYLLRRNPSTPRIPQTPQEEADLTREVQQKADAAMIALNKNPSHVNLTDGLKHTTSIRKRIDPSQISIPKLVSTTTSVETIPLRTPSLTSNSPGPSKLGSRFRKLRGSLRAKNLVSSGEETVTPESVKSPPASQYAYYDSTKLNPPGAPKITSATEASKFKVSVPSPPASAGPGLKGFMARFRNKQRMSETTAQLAGPRATSPSSPAPPISPAAGSLTPRFAEPSTPKNLPSPSERTFNVAPRPAGQPRPMYSRFPPANPPPPPQIPVAAKSLDDSQSAAALEQLFRAANNLGLDENALNDLLARSGSTSSRNLLSRNMSNATSTVKPTESQGSDQVQQISYVGSTSSDQTATPTNYTSTLHEQQSKAGATDVQPVSMEDSLSRKSSVRKPDHIRRPKEGQTENAANTIVRRTIIYAKDSVPQADLATLVQRKNSARRRRISATSLLARSVHDRAPTPPPPKSPTAKRFSADGLPPMPQMPNFLGQADKMLNVPFASTSNPIEKSNSTYESLYEMYSGESRVASMVAGDANALLDQQHTKGDNLASLEPGDALEVKELADGRYVWNIVNVLRDGDDESIYSGRTSFASEYSTREPGTDSLQVVKEHTRSGSKGSVSSVSKKKPNAQQAKIRPETKVFFSSSAQIGRLIESLSQGADAGSFNFLPNLPNRPPGHSASSSLSTNDINWTVEERLDRMLGAMNNS
ncbi:hypothetical protein BDN70DRAFT_881285 [Pholiota conissans]|uniref:Uncharacterized protein n=1 Tax=Pholiota conissans TaxID=109636 RepID=A0A9P5Z0D9_9AGAR|nr:hypothetical protein BDN70DRAFT_881285 [Pholiota conissans]